jgi:hypothetical protein
MLGFIITDAAKSPAEISAVCESGGVPMPQTKVGDPINSSPHSARMSTRLLMGMYSAHK